MTALYNVSITSSTVIEKPLHDLKGNIQKIQVVFDGEFPEMLKNEAEILHTSKVGSVYTVIVKGAAGEVTQKFRAYNPVIFDKVSLTLEEVFIYELGGLGYDFKNIMV